MKSPDSLRYMSNGNLIITGEYFVLLGAEALAVPLRHGQKMYVESFRRGKNIVDWRTNELLKPWFTARLDSRELKVQTTDSMVKAGWLVTVLKAAETLNPGFFMHNISYNIKCDIEFSTSWGWGSSATLINNVAQWINVDPFRLNDLVSDGSGYDIAVSGSECPVFYRRENDTHSVRAADFYSPFKDSLYFVYTGRKQDTKASVDNHINSLRKSRHLISDISLLTDEFVNTNEIDDFMMIIAEHEKILSTAIGHPRIKEEFFPDFAGEIKSLGAWGGDFILAVASAGDLQVKQYFRNKGLNTIFKFNEIVKFKHPVIPE